VEKLDHAKKGRIMTIKENLYIYLYKQHNKLIDEQRAHEDNHENILYDSLSAYRHSHLNHSRVGHLSHPWLWAGNTYSNLDTW
jgi:hypothetical protein